jgi:hypothetical protein
MGQRNRYNKSCVFQIRYGCAVVGGYDFVGARTARPQPTDNQVKKLARRPLGSPDIVEAWKGSRARTARPYETKILL